MNNPLAGTDPTGYAAEIIICQNGKSVVDCGGAPSNQDSSGKSGSGGPDGRPRENTGPGNGATSTRQIPNQATTDIGSQLNTTNVASSGRNGQQGASASEAISFMWNSFWDHRGEVVSGAVAGAADAITQNSGGWIDGGTLTDLTGVNAASEALIAGSYGEWAGVSAATIGILAGRFKTVGHTLENIADGSVHFKRWKRGDTIDKPLKDGSSPSFDVVRSRYWKNRYELSQNTGEFSRAQMSRMRRGVAPKDYNPRTGQWESRELHHHIPQRNGGAHNPINLREVTPDQHRAIDLYRR